jgi:hypothetical protein
MATQERYYNPAAKTIDEIYAPKDEDADITSTVAGRSIVLRSRPDKSMDALAAELFQVKLSPESAQLLSRLHSLRAEISEFLDGARSAKVEELEAKHEAAIVAVREAKRKYSAASQQVFRALQEHTRLEGVAQNAGRRLGDVKYEFSQLSTALMTKAEKAAWSEKIATAQRKAEQAMVDESAAQTHYNNLLRQEGEAEIAHNQAVSVATGIANQIERLTK